MKKYFKKVKFGNVTIHKHRTIRIKELGAKV